MLVVVLLHSKVPMFGSEMRSVLLDVAPAHTRKCFADMRDCLLIWFFVCICLHCVFLLQWLLPLVELLFCIFDFL